MKVLFAVDGTPGSGAAVLQAGQLLSPQNDSVALYFALPEVTIRHASSNEAMRDRARQAIAGAVFSEAQTRLPDGLASTATLLSDEHMAADGIMHSADDWGADLLVIGAGGANAVERFLVGSVSRSIVQTSKRPVLLVRPNPNHRPMQPLNVLFAFDGSSSSTGALDVAAKLTYPTGTKITAVTVIEPLTVGKVPTWVLEKARSADTEAMSQNWEREHEADKRQAREQLAEFMAKQPAPFNSAEIIADEGIASERILHLVAERNIDLVVMGTHGGGLLKRLFIGSTSDKILNYAPCSVLFVRQ